VNETAILRGEHTSTIMERYGPLPGRRTSLSQFVYIVNEQWGAE